MGEARLFQALSDPTRLKIVALLGAGPLNVTGIVNRVRATQPAVSRHLRILREVGLIRDRRLGKEVEYSLEAGRVKEAAVWLGGLVDRRTVAAAASKVVPGDRIPGPGRAAGTEPVAAEDRKAGRQGKERPDGGRPKRMRRISPLEARRGLGPERDTEGMDASEAPAAPVHDRSGRDIEPATDEGGSSPPRWKLKRARGAGVMRRGVRGKRRRAERRERQPEAEAPAAPGADTPASYAVNRDESDGMDDFLL
jgi:DNA-binding transcriptional ArsR family regulator